MKIDFKNIYKKSAGAGDIMSSFAPLFFSIFIFISGCFMTVLGTLPSGEGRLEILRDILPLGVIEFSHFLGSIIGLLLIALSFSLREKTIGAYYITLGLLVIGACISLLKGLDYEQAFVLSLAILLLIPSKRYFYRKHSLVHSHYLKESVFFMSLILLLSLIVGLYFYKHTQYHPDMWWKFAWRGDASRFLRSILGGAILIIFYSLTQILKSRPENQSFPDEAILESLKPIISGSQQASANLVYLRDKYIITSADSSSLIMYGIQGKTAIALGDPIGNSISFPESIAKFRSFCDKNGLRCCFYEISKLHLPLYLDIGMNIVKIGEEARIPLELFTLKGKSKQDMRSARNKYGELGYSFRFYQSDEVPKILPRLQKISDMWMKNKNASEKGFSLGKFDPTYISRFPVATIRDKQGEIQAFVNIWTSANKYEFSGDIMRYNPETPNGLMEFLFTECIVYAQEQGFKYFNFGMAPLSGVKKSEIISTWNKIAGFIYNYGEHFYNFKGLRNYKAKFDPVWESKYLVTENILQVPRALKDITTLISGGVKGIIKK